MYDIKERIERGVYHADIMWPFIYDDRFCRGFGIYTKTVGMKLGHKVEFE